MNYIYSIILGLVQGIAEFLPISSSGHLNLAESLLGIGGLEAMEGNALFNVLLHLATFTAVVIAYWPDVRDMVLELFYMLKGSVKKGEVRENRLMRRQIIMIIVSTIPLFVIVPFDDKIEAIGAYPWAVGLALLLTGCMLYFSDKIPEGKKDGKNITVKDALIIGIMQAFATVPGISRSGSTISTGLACKLSREYAVKFSFLLSLVSVAGAVFLKVLKILKDGVDTSLIGPYIVGMLVAGITGYCCIKLLQKIVSNGKFGGFAWYCWIVGLLAILVSLVKVIFA